MNELWQLAAGDLRPWQVATVLVAAFATGVFHTISGFAGGLVLSILIAPILGVEAVIPVMAVTLVISGASRTWAFRRHIDYATTANVFLPALPCIVLSAFAYTLLAPGAISIALGIFLLVTVAGRRPLERRGHRVGPVGLGLVSVVVGLVSGVTLGGGMMLAPFLMGRGLFRERLAAVFASTGLLFSLVKTAVFLTSTALDAHLFLLGLALGVASVPGNYLGLAILKRVPIRIHTNFVEALILFAATVFLLAGLLGWADPA